MHVLKAPTVILGFAVSKPFFYKVVLRRWCRNLRGDALFDLDLDNI